MNESNPRKRKTRMLAESIKRQKEIPVYTKDMKEIRKGLPERIKYDHFTGRHVDEPRVLPKEGHEPFSAQLKEMLNNYEKLNSSVGRYYAKRENAPKHGIDFSKRKDIKELMRRRHSLERGGPEYINEPRNVDEKAVQSIISERRSAVWRRFSNATVGAYRQKLSYIPTEQINNIK